MTLQNGLIHDRTAYLWSDTAFWTENGRRMGTAPKVFGGEFWPWAGTWSGRSPAREWNRLPTLFAATPDLHSPERLLGAAIEILRYEASEGRECRVLLSWPDERRGAWMYHIAAEEMPGRKAFEPVPLAKYLCWGGVSDWFAPYAERDLTPAEMRECIALQLRDNAQEMYEQEIEDPVSDVIETRVSQAGISHHLYRLEDGELRAVEIEVGAEGVESRVVRAVEREAQAA